MHVSLPIDRLVTESCGAVSDAMSGAAKEATKRRATAAARALALFVVVCVAAAIAGCGRKQASGDEQLPAIAVKTAVIAPVPISDWCGVSGHAQVPPFDGAEPSGRGAGHEYFCEVRRPRESRNGAMQIDPLKQQATLGSQEAARAAQEANVRFAQIEWERSDKLFEAGVISKQEHDQARRNLETAQHQLKSLDSQVQERTSRTALLSRERSHVTVSSATFPCGWEIALRIRRRLRRWISRGRSRFM